MFAVTSASGGFGFTRDVGNIVMSATEIEALTLNALGGDDRVATIGLPGTSQSLSGGAHTAADVLDVDALGSCAVSTPGSFTITGAQPITFTEFETVNLINECGAVANVPTLSPLALAALGTLLAIAALLVMRLQSSA
ncbi:MAG: hypothetical protein ABR576_12100 [Thermoanaerobaculia bacterium]